MLPIGSYLTDHTITQTHGFWSFSPLYSNRHSEVESSFRCTCSSSSLRSLSDDRCMNCKYHVSTNYNTKYCVGQISTFIARSLLDGFFVDSGMLVRAI